MSRFEDPCYVDAVMAGTAITALHPIQPTIAKADGCLIVVHEVAVDRKINLHRHEFAIL